MSSPTPLPDDSAPKAPEVHARAKRLWWRRALRALAGLAALLVIVVVGLLVFLRTQTGRETVRSIVVSQIQNLLADDATVSADRLEGNFLTGARLTGVRIERRGEAVLTADSILVDYTLRTLLSRTFSASHLVVAGPNVYVRQYADSTFNVTGLFVQDPERDTTKAGVDVLIDEVAVTRGRAEVHFLNPRRDSVLVVRDFATRLSDLVITKEELNADISALALTAVATDGETSIDLAGAGRFTKQQLALREFRLVGSEGTRIRGEALYAFEAGALPVFDADLEAAPLALADIRAFAPVPAYGDPRLRLSAESDGQQLRFALRGALPRDDGDDATIVLDGALSRRSDDGPLAYKAQGSLRRFDPSVLTQNPALAAEITGDLTLDLEGTSARTLDGPFSVQLRETTAAGRRIDRLDLDGRVTSGLLRFDLDGAIPGLDLVAEGEARPFERIPTFDVRGTARDVNLATLVPGQQGRFAGRFAVEGRGNSLETLAGTAALSLSRAEIPLEGRVLRLSRAELDADIVRSTLTFDADVTVADGGGRLAASGSTVLGADPIVYSVDRGRMDGLNLAVLTGNPAQQSSLTGTFSVDGRGVDPQTLSAELDLALAPSRYGEYTVQSARLDGSLRGGRAAFDLAADLGRSGALTAVGTARPFADPLAYSAEGRVRNLDLAALTQNPDQFSDLTGTYSITGSGIDPQTLAADARIQLDPSSYGLRQIGGADLRLALNRGALSLTGDVDIREGQFTLDVSGRPFDADPTITLGERTCFGGVDAGELTRNPNLSTDLNGCFAGSVRGFSDPSTLDADGVLTLSRSRVNDAELTSGRISLDVTDGAIDASGIVRTEGGDLLNPEAAEPAFTPDGELRFALQGSLGDEPSYTFDAQARALNVSALAGLDGAEPIVLSADVDLSGRGLDPATAVAQGRVRSAPTRAAGFAIDTLATDFRLASGVLALDTLIVRTDLATAEAGGTIALFDSTAANDFRVRADVVSLAPLRRFLPEGQVIGLESGRLDLAVTGGANGTPVAVTGTVEARQFSYGQGGEAGLTTVTGVDAVLTATVDRGGLDSLGLGAVDGSLTSSFDVLATPRLVVQEGTIETTVRDGSVVFDAGVIVDGRRDLDVAARLDLNNGTGVIIEAGRFSLDGDEWTLTDEARIAFDADLITIETLRLVGDQNGELIAVNGTLDFVGEQNLRVQVSGLDVGGFADLAGIEGLGGVLGATLKLVGPAEAPVLDGRVTLDDLSSRGERFGALEMDVDYALGTFGLSAVLTHVDGETLTADGTLPFQFALARGGPTVEAAEASDAIAFTARADAFPIGWARPFLDDRAYNALDGALALDLAIGGTQASPELSGRAALSDGRLGVVATGRVYEPVSASLAFSNDRIELERLAIGAPTAPEVLVTGTITLAELSVGELDLTVTPRDFLAMDTRTFSGIRLGSGIRPLRFTGTLTEPVLSGDVALTAGDIYVTDELGGVDLDLVTLSPEAIADLEATYGYNITARDTTQSVFLDALRYDINATIDRGVWLRSASSNLGYDIEFAGQVEAQKAPFAESSRLFGQIDLVRGSVETLNRRFDIDRGVLIFNGEPLEANVDLLATADVRLSSSVSGQSAVEVSLAATGEADDLQIRLSSDPPLPAADIATLLVTGQLSNDVLSTGAISGAIGGAGLGFVSGLAEGAVSQSLGLDLVEIDTDGSGNLLIRVGKYLTTRAFASVAFPISQSETNAQRQGSATQLSLEYQLQRWLMLQSEVGGLRGAGAGVQAETSF